MFGAVVALAPLLAHGQPAGSSYPSQVIHMIVPFPPAGPTDVIARPLIEKMGSLWPHPIVAEWRPGGNTIIGTDAVAKAAADGHTWLFTTFTHTTTTALHKSLPYDPLADLAGAAMLATFPAVAVVPTSSPAKTMAQFVAFAKSQPGKLNYLIPGVGTAVHLNSELLKRHAGIDMIAVPYKGLAPAMPDLLSGRLSFGFVSLSLAAPHIKSGKLRPLALAAPRRNALLPEVPTMAEAGYPDSQVLAWFAILVPAKTPRDIVARINRDVSRAMADPEVVRKIEAGGRHRRKPDVAPGPRRADEARGRALGEVHQGRRHPGAVGNAPEVSAACGRPAFSRPPAPLRQ